MSNLTPHILFKVKGKQWDIQSQNKFEVRIRATQNLAPGWFRIVVIAKNQAAVAMLKDSSLFSLHQNHNTINANLLQENYDKAALVFLRHNPLKTLTLHWHKLPALGEAPQFLVKIKTISTASAWFYMLTQISRQHAASGGSRSYIYRLSRARTKRAGIDVALEKLVKEYQPQLAYQLISCEPYSYWRQYKEPSIYAKALCNNSYAQLPFTIVVKAKLDHQALQRTLHSVQQQSHPHWQLWLCQTATAIPPELEKQFQYEPRIRFNQDVPLSEDDWYVFMEEGDQLATHCLQQLAKQISTSPAAIVYADHDLLNMQHLRVAPRFKPQWSPDLLMHQNYIGQAFTVKGLYLKQLSQEHKWWLLHHYPILLEALLNISPNQRAALIHRVPLMLFHQAQSNQKLGYSDATVGRLKTLYQKLTQQNGEQLLKITKGKADNLFHLHYVIPKPLPLVSLIIPTRDALEITRTCVNSILYLTHYPHYEIIIVDNQSQQTETLAWFEQISQHDKVRVIKYDKPFNYSAINNFAVKHAKGSIIGLVNNDTEVINKQWLTEMLQHACRPEIGCVGAKLYYHDDTIQHAGVILGLWGLAGHSHKNYLRYDRGHQARLISVQNLSAVTAACLLVRKDVYEEVGGLEEYHLTVAFNDVDFCLKVMQAGYRNLFTPYAELYHYESKTRGKEDTPEKKAREQGEIRYMQQKWPALLDDDPHYNPNLTRSREDFTVSID